MTILESEEKSGTGEPPVAVITGGHGTLAQALRRELTAQGWRVLAPAKAELDVRDPQAVAVFFESLTRLDLLINNAGIRRDAPFSKQSPEDWTAVIDTNLTGGWRCCRAALPVMRRQGRGHIVNISSHTARHGVPGQAAYGASKAALLALTQSLAAECGPDNIRVNAILPGWMPTAFNETLPVPVHEAARRAHHLGQFNTPDHTARFIAFLHSMPLTSGQVFQLDSRPGSWL